MTRCPRCGKALDDEAQAGEDEPATCDVCGAELVTDGGAEVAVPSYTELSRVYDARTEKDLRFAHTLIEGADIPVFSNAARVGSHAFPYLAVLVPVDFAEKARAVLRENGLLKTPVDEAALAAVWAKDVVPALAGGQAASLASAIALEPGPLRAAVFEGLEEAGPIGLTVLRDLALSLAARGPREPAREAAGYLAACEAFRDRRGELIAALGAIAARGADADLAARVIGAVERFLGSADAERALVPLLEHANAGVRDAAIEALYAVSGGETLGFEPDAAEDARRAAVRRWRERVGGWLR